MNSKELTRFLKFVKVNPANECWEWTGHRQKIKGYGRFKTINLFTGKWTSAKAHRVSFAHFIKEPGDLYVCHSCDNTKCVNPDHLFLGTHQDNMDDMKAKGRGRSIGRSAPGEKNPKAILTEEKVREIRAFPRSVKNTDLALIYSVTHSLISAIRLNKIWKHVT